MMIILINKSFNNFFKYQNIKFINKRFVSNSNEWFRRHINDEFVKKSRYHNYRSRAAFKLIEIDDKFKLLKPGMIVIECGAAPGSWTQVLVERLKLKPSPDQYKTGAVIALDRSEFTPIPGAICLPRTDFTSHQSQAKILAALGNRKADLILSDMAPNVTGQHDYDHEHILKLVHSCYRFSLICLKNSSGTLLFKMFHGNQTDKLVDDLRKVFGSVKYLKPEASRNDSTELYILCRNFQSPPKQPDQTKSD